MRCAVCKKGLYERFYTVDVYDSVQNERSIVLTCLDCAKRFEHGKCKCRYKITIRRQTVTPQVATKPLRAFADAHVVDLV